MNYVVSESKIRPGDAVIIVLWNRVIHRTMYRTYSNFFKSGGTKLIGAIINGIFYNVTK